MKPAERTAKAAVTPKIGRFATLGVLLHAQGSGAPARGSIAAPFVARSLVVLCALAGIFALSTAAVAQAAPPKLVPNGYFRASAASGIAVDQSSGDIFVTGFDGVSETKEFVTGHGEKFDAAGKVLSPPTSFAEGLRYGVAVNPTNGRLYVASLFGEIEIYDPNSGELLSSFKVPSFFSEFGELFQNHAQIATDSAGNVYVPNARENKVFEYSETGTLLETFTGSGVHVLKGPTGVAVDPSGNVWIADDGHNRIEELSPTGAFRSEFESEGVKALALDGHGDVLAIVDNGADFCGSIHSPCEHLVEYSSSGAQLFDAGAGNFGEPAGEVNFGESSVAVNEASGRVYVTDGFKDSVWVYQPPQAPTLGHESATEVGTSDAKLGALVSPGGAQTSYRFEYDTRPYAEGEGAHGTSVPFPAGVAGEGFSTHAVWAAAKGLEPGTTYHYRAIITSGVGTVVGPDETFTTVGLAQVACPNEDARGGSSALLPDCRAYELVTQAGKTGAQPEPGLDLHTGSNLIAANDGDGYTYQSQEVMPGSQSAGLQFIATRGPEGWSTQDALPLQPYTGDRCTFNEDGVVTAYAADLSKAVILVNNYQRLLGGTGSDQCHGETAEVVPGEPFGVENLLLHDYETGSYQLINVTPPGVAPTPPKLEAASADLKLVIFSERAKLTPEAQNNTVNLYEWHDGAVRLFKLLLPSGAPVAGELVSVSPDGSEIFFKAGGKLYVRVNDERTVQIDEVRGGSGPGGGGSYASLSADESQVFFSDEASAGLTSDTEPGSGTNLYRYDIDTGQLSDLTPVAGADAAFAGTIAEGTTSFSGIGEDGAYVYFTSPAVMTGFQANQFGEEAEAHKENLYVDHDGTLAFVMHGRGGAFSANGAYFAFESHASLTGYDNNGRVEIYIYSAQAKRFECASCNPDGEAPSSGVSFGPAPGLSHQVANSGQVLFETTEALLPRDTDGVSDVYEFDFDSGLHLISSGTSAYASSLLPGSASGNDVFFLTRQQLVPQDGFQEAIKFYDARVDGGFPVAATPPFCTTADACRSASTPQPSIYGAPSSQTFSGAGNLAPPPAVVKLKLKTAKCKKGDVKNSRGKCVRKKHEKAKKAKKASNKGRA